MGLEGSVMYTFGILKKHKWSKFNIKIYWVWSWWWYQSPLKIFFLSKKSELFFPNYIRQNFDDEMYQNYTHKKE